MFSNWNNSKMPIFGVTVVCVFEIPYWCQMFALILRRPEFYTTSDEFFFNIYSCLLQWWGGRDLIWYNKIRRFEQRNFVTPLNSQRCNVEVVGRILLACWYCLLIYLHWPHIQNVSFCSIHIVIVYIRFTAMKDLVDNFSLSRILL